MWISCQQSFSRNDRTIEIWLYRQISPREEGGPQRNLQRTWSPSLPLRNTLCDLSTSRIDATGWLIQNGWINSHQIALILCWTSI
jgi:hypothetical protein